MQQFPKPESAHSVQYGKHVALLGSCFSTHLSACLRRAGFSVPNNPFGVVFHPIPLARFVIETLREAPAERLLQRDDIWLSWDAGSELYALSEGELRAKLQTIRATFLDQLATAQTLFVTLGSAHGYRLNATGEVVANCHKAPPAAFRKELTTVDVLFESWSEALRLLKARFPQLQVVFTVSPVRYVRDGWVENNRSKARLFELVGQLEEHFSVGYFPAYELVNDVLRDYRYFDADGVHPNAQAVQHVWELFRSWYFDEPTAAVADKMEALRKMEEHRLLFPESVKSAEFKKSFHEKRESFLSLHPYIIW